MTQQKLGTPPWYEHAGSTANRSPANSAHPTICSNGAPLTRCRTMCSSWLGESAVLKQHVRLVFGEHAAG
jgi:hypothetical protein